MDKSIRHWARQNKKLLKSTFCDLKKFPPAKDPVTIFMAGTPGAGKTEFSKSLVAALPNIIARIDADEIRDMMREIGYNGANSSRYQSGVTDIVSNLYASCVKQNQSVLIDGTFAYANWRQSIEQSVLAGRKVEIYYLYQDPKIAWDFVKLREKKLGRHVPIEVFIHGYHASIKNVEDAKSIYGESITVYVAINNYLKQVEKIRVDTQYIAKYLPNVYNDKELKHLLL